MALSSTPERVRSAAEVMGCVPRGDGTRRSASIKAPHSRSWSVAIYCGTRSGITEVVVLRQWLQEILRLSAGSRAGIGVS
jgi:hypothetical protein